MKSISQFEFFVPTRIVYGQGVVNNLVDEIKALEVNKPLIVTDRGIVKAKLLEPIEKLLKDSNYNYDVFDDILPNPRDTSCEQGAALAKRTGADVIIAVGGGSPLDTAKAIAMLATNPGSVHQYFGFDVPKNKGLPLITIPTTAGTGSEVTIWSVITDTRKEPFIKESIGSSMICPTLALVDPLLTVGMPQELTASTGMDALTHAIEGYTAIPASPITDIFAMYAIEKIADYLPAAYANGENVEARDHMMIASMMAGISFSNSDVAAVHCLAEAIGGLFDIPHGIANSIFLPQVMKYNLISNPKKFADIAAAMGEQVEGLTVMEAAQRSVKAVFELSDLVRIPRLREVGIKEEHFLKIAEISMANLSLPDNPRTMTNTGFMEILHDSFHDKRDIKSGAVLLPAISITPQHTELADEPAISTALRAKKILNFEADLCIGCKLCHLACSAQNEGVFNPTLARLKVNSEYTQDDLEVTGRTCDLCLDCVNACPTGAIQEKNGRLTFDLEACTDCKLCVDICPNGVIVGKERGIGVCVQCMSCANWCPTKALTSKEVSR